MVIAEGWEWVSLASLAESIVEFLRSHEDEDKKKKYMQMMVCLLGVNDSLLHVCLCWLFVGVGVFGGGTTGT